MTFVPNLPAKCTWNKDSDGSGSPHSAVPWDSGKSEKILPDILSFIGHTPLIKLNKIPESCGVKCNVFAKCEFFGPGGSNKDRFAARAVRDAEESGLLYKGYTIIDPSSGNSGIGVALAAAVKGYHCIVVASEEISYDKAVVLKALGAELVTTSAAAGSTSPDGIYAVADKLKKDTPRSVILNQYTNAANPLAHYDCTAEEILYALDGDIDMFVAVAATGGTLTGVGKKFKEKFPDIKVIGVDPENSVLAEPDYLNKPEGQSEVEAAGNDFVPTIFDRSVVDSWIKTNDTETFEMARRIIKEEGLLCGGSSGAALVGALRMAKELEPDKNCVVVFSDCIRNYISKFACDQWMEAKFFKPCPNPKELWWWDVNVADLKLPRIQTENINAQCHKVLHMMKKFDVEQIPIVDGKGGVIGVVTMHRLINALLSKQVHIKNSIEKIITRAFPKMERSANLGVISRYLEIEPYVVIVDKQRKMDVLLEIPFAVVTSEDILQFLEANGDNCKRSCP